MWAVNYYAGCQRAPDGRHGEPVAYTVEEGDLPATVVDDLADRGSSAAAASSATCCCAAPARRTRSGPATTGSHGDDAGRGHDDPHDAARRSPPSGSRSRRLPAHPDRRAVEAAIGIPAATVPEPGPNAGTFPGRRNSPRGRQPGGVPVPGDLPDPEEGDGRRGDPTAARRVHRPNRGPAVGQRGRRSVSPRTRS